MSAIVSGGSRREIRYRWVEEMKTRERKLFTKKRVLMGLLAVSSAYAFLLLGVWLGLKVSDQLTREYSTVARFINKAKRGYSVIFQSGSPQSRTIPSNRLNLTLTEYVLPLDLKNGAGGISLDDHGGVLIVDLEGKVFRFFDGETTQLDVKTPDPGVSALKDQLAAGELGPITINFGHVRFNDILLHKRDTEHILLISYTDWHADRRCLTSTLAKARVSGDTPGTWSVGEGDWSIVARTRPCLAPFPAGSGIKGAEAGGRLISRSETELLWTSGAYGNDDSFDKTRPDKTLAQSDGSDYGKVLSVDLVRNVVTPLAKGLRNPQGIDIGSDGRIWVTDHGMRGGDELNLLTAGSNFGFPSVTLGTKYSTEPGGTEPYHTGHQGYDKPVVAFTPSIAPTSVLFVENFNVNWDGQILVGGLKRTLNRIYIEDGQVLLVEPINIGVRVRDLVQMGDGAIAILTSDRKFAVLTPNVGETKYQRMIAVLSQAPDPAERGKLLEVFASCLTCHSLEEHEHGAGPSLFEVCGRKPDATAYQTYSGALARSVNLWDQDSLARFIDDPEATAPGTAMAWDGTKNMRLAELLATSLCEVES